MSDIFNLCCCEEASGCGQIQASSFKYWAPHAPFPLWSRGTFTFAPGDGTSAYNEFLYRLGVAFDTGKSIAVREAR